MLNNWIGGSMTLDTILDKEKYVGARSYSQSKVALLLFTYYLHQKYYQNNIYGNAISISISISILY
jgi:NAD(P)-dependent dehydrogenase (short-subunit alcohol dehydrogenase family)